MLAASIQTDRVSCQARPVHQEAAHSQVGRLPQGLLLGWIELL